jgi:SMI1/KNR4 family protein SUKH-1
MTLPAPLMSCEVRGGASASALRAAEKLLGRPLPQDYKDVLLQSDGLEGFISDDNYLLLWSASDLANLNDTYAVAEFLPGVTLVGTDGADTGYGFRTDHGRLEYVAVPLVGMSPDAISVMGESFVELLDRLTQH